MAPISSIFEAISLTTTAKRLRAWLHFFWLQQHAVIQCVVRRNDLLQYTRTRVARGGKPWMHRSSRKPKSFLCQENFSARRTDSILLCGFDMVLWRRNSKSVTVRWRQLGRLREIMITLCWSTQTAPYNIHWERCTATREQYSSISNPNTRHYT